jgi:drug/metabolite transporter (DMT)-like permease
MATKGWAIILMVFSTLAIASAQILYKQGLIQDQYLKVGVFIFFGLFMYGVGALLIAMALKGGELSVLFPIIALSYVFVNLASRALFNEPFTVVKWAGIAVIVVGATLVGYGGNNKK